MIYMIVADGAKPHLTDNYLLAQIIERDLKNDGYLNTGIQEDGDIIICLYMKYNSLKNKWCELNPGFLFKVPLEDWRIFFNNLPHSDKRQKKRNRLYSKLYGFWHVICLTPSQRKKLQWELISKSEEFEYLYIEEFAKHGH